MMIGYERIKYMPFISPSMLTGENKTDTEILQETLDIAEREKKAVYLEPKEYRVEDTLIILSTLNLFGDGAVLKFAKGKSGIVFINTGPESVIRDITLTSLDGKYPEDSHTTGLSVAGEHLKLYNVNVNNFGTGIFFNDRLSEENQTGSVIDNVHVRYCADGIVIGTLGEKDKMTDFYINDVTISAKNVCLQINSCIGYLINNLHCWGDRPEICIKARNCSLTSFSNLYLEEVKEKTGMHMQIHSRKGWALNNATFVFGDAKCCIETDGSKGDIEYIINNVIIRSDDVHEPVLYTEKRRSVPRITNVICPGSENTSNPFNENTVVDKL